MICDSLSVVNKARLIISSFRLTVWLRLTVCLSLHMVCSFCKSISWLNIVSRKSTKSWEKRLRQSWHQFRDRAKPCQRQIWVGHTCTQTYVWLACSSDINKLLKHGVSGCLHDMSCRVWSLDINKFSSKWPRNTCNTGTKHYCFFFPTDFHVRNDFI